MNYRWDYDERFPDDIDLEVLHADGDWRIIAFVRWDNTDKNYKCLFMGMEDNEFPDGKVYKTKRAAKKFCEHHLPVMWIRHNTKEADE